MKELIENISAEQIISILTAIGVMIIFRLISSTLAKLIIKIFRVKTKEKKDIRKNPFYLPLRTIIRFLGIYIALNMLKETLAISVIATEIINKILKISLIIFVAKAFGQSLDEKNGIFIKLHMKSGKEIERTTANIILRTIRIIIYIIAGFMVLSELGYNISGFLTGLGLGGVVITLAAQDTAKSLIGGVAIFIDKPFKVGDFISIGTYQGTVEEIKFRSTSIRTIDNSVLHIPNSEVSIAAVINYSEMQKRRYNTTLSLRLDTKLEKVESIRQQIEKMLSEIEVVEPESIIVRFQDILSNGLDVVVIAYLNEINYKEYLKIKEHINYEIMRILEKENAEITNNAQTVYIKK